MTPRERWLAVLDGCTPDRVPCDYWATAEVTQRLLRDLGCADEAALWQRLGIDECVGVEHQQTLPLGTEAEVREAVRRTIADAGQNGRLWLGSSTEIHPAVPVANALAMWDEIEASA